MRKTVSRDLYNSIQYIALENAPLEISSMSWLLYIFPDNRAFFQKVKFNSLDTIHGTFFAGMCMTEETKLPFI